MWGLVENPEDRFSYGGAHIIHEKGLKVLSVSIMFEKLSNNSKNCFQR